MTKLFVVRHAHAGSRHDWDGPDHLRPLDDKGWRQAEAICDLLTGEGIKRLVSSPITRSVQTMEPLADKIGLPVTIDDRLAEGAGGGAALELVDELRGTTAAICSHGDVIPDLLDALAARGLELPERRKWQKASIWALEGDRDQLTAGRYTPPPA
jgi:broad specificity phosphatase PhoE